MNLITKRVYFALVLTALTLAPLAPADFARADSGASAKRQEESERSKSSRKNAADRRVAKEFATVDRRERTNPYAATPFSVMSGSGYGEASRYRTDQGWSRGRSYWWGG